MFRDRPHRTLVGLTAALLATVSLAACSGGGSSSTSDSAAGSNAVGAEPGPAASGSGAAGDSAKEGTAAQPGTAFRGASGGPADTGTGAVDPAVLTAPGSTLARRATVALKVRNLSQSVAAIRSLSVASDGVILAENIGTGGTYVPLEDRSKVTATTYGEITLSVPATRLDTVMAELGKLGTVIRSESSSEEVGKQIVDTQSRLETMRESVDRVRALMTKATDLTQIVNLEAEVSRRQADLEALEAQLAALKNSVARSPIQISLTTETDVIAAPKPAQDTGFMAGLLGGWTAFTSSVRVVLTIVGALVPFAAAFALVGVPLWLAWRRRRPAPATVTVPTVLPE
ncbi:DUF4349 domain-containing protein [Phycicoccus sp. Root563]|uniref:DUF4349 domain-containing protein n=1 Tax=Phycicoccus sp. Root563 TaxID=1736562 RepID=UPI000B330FE3|nr:DUF4349 domain-containing protein [Phycicoccus sp. Root563]